MAIRFLCAPPSTAGLPVPTPSIARITLNAVRRGPWCRGGGPGRQRQQRPDGGRWIPAQHRPGLLASQSEAFKTRGRGHRTLQGWMRCERIDASAFFLPASLGGLRLEVLTAASGTRGRPWTARGTGGPRRRAAGGTPGTPPPPVGTRGRGPAERRPVPAAWPPGPALPRTRPRPRTYTVGGRPPRPTSGWGQSRELSGAGRWGRRAVGEGSGIEVTTTIIAWKMTKTKPHGARRLGIGRLGALSPLPGQPNQKACAGRGAKRHDRGPTGLAAGRNRGAPGAGGRGPRGPHAGATLPLPPPPPGVGAGAQPSRKLSAVCGWGVQPPHGM